MTQQVTQDHRLLKAVVIGLGLLLLLGTGALIFGLVAKGAKHSPAPIAAGSAEPLILPQGASIADMAVAERQIVLRVTQAEREELVLIDLQTGRVARRIPILRTNSPPAGTPEH